MGKICCAMGGEIKANVWPAQCMGGLERVGGHLSQTEKIGNCECDDIQVSGEYPLIYTRCREGICPQGSFHDLCPCPFSRNHMIPDDSSKPWYVYLCYVRVCTVEGRE